MGYMVLFPTNSNCSVVFVELFFFFFILIELTQDLVEPTGPGSTQIGPGKH